VPIAPADVGADGVVLLGVATVVSAVAREVAQGGDRARGRYWSGTASTSYIGLRRSHGYEPDLGGVYRWAAAGISAVMRPADADGLARSSHDAVAPLMAQLVSADAGGPMVA